MNIRLLTVIVCLLLTDSAQALLDFQTNKITAKWTGRFLADIAWYDENSSVSLGDGTHVRSLRLGAKGELCPICNYKAEVDFAKGDVSIRNALISLEPQEHYQLNIGHFKPPVSLEFLTSSLHITFLERALPNVFVTDRRLGVGVDYSTELKGSNFFTLSLGGFGENANENNDEGNEGYHSSIRTSLGHHNPQNCLSVIGASLSYTRTNHENTIRYRAIPESSVTDTRLVDTGLINAARDTWLTVAEMAFQLKRWSIQGEYFHNVVHRRNAPSLHFNGYYAYASYFITGDNRPFSIHYSKFSRVEPHLPWGALELALRYSYLNLNDRDIQGGHEHNVTCGVNWYLNPYLRFLANIIFADANQRGVVSKPTIFTVRAQFDFG